MSNFSPTQVVGDSWAIFKNKWLTVYAVLILAMVVEGVLSGLIQAVQDMALLLLVLGLLGIVIRLVSQMSVSLAMLQIMRGQSPSFEDTVQPMAKGKRMIDYFLASLMVGLVVIVGLIFLIIPGLYLAIKYMFVPLRILDEGVPVSQAFEDSATMTKDVKFDVVVLWFLVVLMNLAGLLALGIGLLITIPVSSLVVASAYQQLKPQLTGSGEMGKATST